MNKELQTFTNPLFGDLEILTIGGKEYFPATKVASILGYKRPEDAVNRHCIQNYPWSVKHGVGVQNNKVIPIPREMRGRVILNNIFNVLTNLSKF